MMIFRKATMEDAGDIGKLYDNLCDYLHDNENYCGWKKGVYPTFEDGLEAITDNNLYVVTIDDKITGTVILRHTPEKGYRTVKWQKDISYDKIYVIYTLAVAPSYLNIGVATMILQSVEQLSRDEGMKALRLDVTEKNLPAINLYEKAGFMKIGKVDLGYGAYGLDWFYLYEKILI